MLRMIKGGLIAIEDARIFFRNFAGKESKYNREGKRNFCVEIEDEDFAQQMIRDGWNVKLRPPREEGDPVRYYIQVAVNFRNYPPHIVLVTRKNQTDLTEDEVHKLDSADIQSVDMVINPRPWRSQEGTPNEKTGVKAYLREMYVTLNEDEFAEKYAR